MDSLSGLPTLFSLPLVVNIKCKAKEEYALRATLAKHGAEFALREALQHPVNCAPASQHLLHAKFRLLRAVNVDTDEYRTYCYTNIYAMVYLNLTETALLTLAAAHQKASETVSPISPLQVMPTCRRYGLI